MKKIICFFRTFLISMLLLSGGAVLAPPTVGAADTVPDFGSMEAERSMELLC